MFEIRIGFFKSGSDVPNQDRVLISIDVLNQVDVLLVQKNGLEK